MSRYATNKQLDAEEMVQELVEALEAVVRVADRATVEFDMARKAIARARGEA